MPDNPLQGLISPTTYQKLERAAVLNMTRVRDYAIKLTFLELRKTHRADESIRMLAEEIFFRSEERIRAVIYKEHPTASELAAIIYQDNHVQDDQTLRLPFKNFWGKLNN